MEYLFYLALIVVSVKIYNKLFLKWELKKALKNPKVKYKTYDNYKELELNRNINIERFEFKANSIEDKMAYYVIYPKNFDSNKSYNILYLLHGLRDQAIYWVEKAKLGEIFYQLLEEKAIDEMILVLPESGFEGRSWYSNWRNDQLRAYEDYFSSDLIVEVEKNFNIKRRAISGFSMGGYGALKLSLKHLELFSAVSSFAGALNFPRLFIAELKGLGLLKHMRTNKYMTKTDDTRHFARVFGDKLKFFRSENVYNILRKTCKHHIEEIKEIDFLLSVGEKDNSFYTMLYQWEDVIGEMEKRGLSYRGRLVKDGEHTWSYVERELPAVLKFHSRSFKGERYE